MRSSRLTNILKTFSGTELKEFEKFLNSPYFSRGRNLVPFFKVIKTYHPDFDPGKFLNENIYKKLFPEKKYGNNSDKHIKTLSHELIRLAEEFMIQSDFKTDTGARNYYLIESLRQRKLYDEYQKKYLTATENNMNSFGGSLHDFISLYFLKDSYNEFCIDTRQYRESFETLASLDEIAVMIALIRGYRAIENKHLSVNGYNLEPINNFAEDLIANLDSEKMMNEIKIKNPGFYPYAEINFLNFKISEFPEKKEYYFEFKSFINENLHLFGHVERYILFCRLSAYCLQTLDKKGEDTIFIREEFDNYDMALKLGLHKWSEKDHFSLHHFRNIFFSALNLNELAWLDGFVEKFTEELPPEDRDNMRELCNAHLNYERKNYEKALENLSNIKINFEYYKFDIKYLSFKIFYDMKLYEQAYSSLEAFRQFIKKLTKLSPGRVIKIKNFVSCAKKLLSIKTSGNKYSQEFLIDEINSKKTISSRKWLLERAEELAVR